MMKTHLTKNTNGEDYKKATPDPSAEDTLKKLDKSKAVEATEQPKSVPAIPEEA